MQSMTISDEIRRAIKNCGASRYRISKATGVSEGMLSRFISRETDMSLRTLNRIAPIIGVRVIVKRPKKAASKGK